MNVLFLTLVEFDSFQERHIYTDLMREFIRNRHRVFMISPVERKRKTETHLIEEGESRILRLKIGNTQKTNIIEKGISTVMLEPTFLKAIKTFFSEVKFDLVLYSTPPITLVSAVEYVKKRDNAITYLLLKDIFPQNAVDIGMMNTGGLWSLLYKHFRAQEKALYSVSDYIGCMSRANVNYLLAHNPEIDPAAVEVCPNSIEVVDKAVDEETRRRIREKYGIPADKRVFVYGGNLGKPQGIPFVLECLRRTEEIRDAVFLIVGDGTEFHWLQERLTEDGSQNVILMRRMPKEDYDTMVGACDVGLIFLDHRFTIPNFPSRLLAYLQARLPVLAVTDPNTDIGKIIVEGGFGWWCESNDAARFSECVKEILSADLAEMGARGFAYLNREWSAGKAYETIAASALRGEKA